MGEDIKDMIIETLLKKVDDLTEQLDKSNNLERIRIGSTPESFFIVLPEEYEPRASGRTTRLVDKYVQDLFNNINEWVEIEDHYNSRHAHKHVFDRVLNRMHLEHPRAVLSSNRNKFTIKINK